MRRAIFAVAVFIIALGVVGPVQAVDPGIFMPPYNDIVNDIDEAVYRQYEHEISVWVPNPYIEFRARMRMAGVKLSPIHMLKRDDCEAFCSPGAIYVTSGILNKNDAAGIAAIILHEQGHIENGDHKAMYESIRQQYNSLASASYRSGSSESLRLARKLIPQVVRVFNKDMEFAADRYAWDWLPSVGYEQSALINVLDKIDRGQIKAPKIFSTHPPSKERIVKLESYPKTPPQEITPCLWLSPELTDVDPAPYLPVTKGEKIEGLSSCVLAKGVIYLLAKGGEVKFKKPKRDFFSLLQANDPMSVGTEEELTIPGKATELILLVKNPSPDKHMMVTLQVNEDVQGLAGHPGKPTGKYVQSEDKDSDKWPYNAYVAVRVDLEKLQKEKRAIDRMVIFTSTLEASSKARTFRLDIPIKQ